MLTPHEVRHGPVREQPSDVLLAFRVLLEEVFLDGDIDGVTGVGHRLHHVGGRTVARFGRESRHVDDATGHGVLACVAIQDRCGANERKNISLAGFRDCLFVLDEASVVVFQFEFPAVDSAQAVAHLHKPLHGLQVRQHQPRLRRIVDILNRRDLDRGVSNTLLCRSFGIALGARVVSGQSRVSGAGLRARRGTRSI